MTIASSGPLTLQDIANEFGGSTPHSLDEYYRGGANVPAHVNTVGIPASGAISIGDFYGKAKRVVIALTISADTANYDLYANRGANYAAGYTDITLTINSGVTVSSASTASYALSVNGFTSGDTVSIINNGTVVGAGGAGGRGANSSSAPANAVAGSAAGPALYLNYASSITNNGTIAAGGGGGGGGSGRSYASGKTTLYQGGGGGGGGAGVAISAAGAGGTGSSGASYNGNAGSPGTATAGGAGGAAKNSAGAGGAGGARGAVGASGTTGSTTIRGTAAGGGATSNYITGNSFATWVATGTLLGNVA